MDNFLHYQASRLHALVYANTLHLDRSRALGEISAIIADLQSQMPEVAFPTDPTPNVSLFVEIMCKTLTPNGFFGLVSRLVKKSQENIIIQVLQLACKNVCGETPDILTILLSQAPFREEFSSVFNMFGMSAKSFFPTDLSEYNPIITLAVYAYVIVERLTSMEENEISVAAQKTAEDIEELLIPKTANPFEAVFGGTGSNIVTTIISAFKDIIFTSRNFPTDEDIAADGDEDIKSEHISDDLGESV